MSTNESFRAGLEARRGVARSPRPDSRHDVAVQQYLAAAAHLERVDRATGTSEPAAATVDPEPPTGQPAHHGSGLSSSAAAYIEAVPSSAEYDKASVRTDLVVVGVDTSQASHAAVEWAADEVERRHGALHLVHAWAEMAQFTRGGAVPGLDYPALPDGQLDVINAALHDHGRALLEAVAAGLRRSHPDIEITTRLTHDDPASALRRESQHARLTVLGARGIRRVAGVLVGSVALSIASDNPAPVAVVHADALGLTDGPVVVGVDGSPASEAAIAFAFDSASVRGVDLIAVHSWNDTVIAGDFPTFPLLVDPAAIEQEEHALLSEQLAGWRDKYPDVTVHHRVVRGRPTPALLEATRTAQLVVVGSRGRGGFAGLLLGSTSHALIAHAACPVVIARARSFG